MLRRTLAQLAVIVVSAAGIAAGCGSSSSKPAYCGDVTNFTKAVEELKQASFPSGIPAAVSKIKSTGQTALASVKGNFAPETSAVKSSLTGLENSVKQLTSSSGRASALAQIPSDVQALVTAGENLAKSAKSDCS